MADDIREQLAEEIRRIIGDAFNYNIALDPSVPLPPNFEVQLPDDDTQSDAREPVQQSNDSPRYPTPSPAVEHALEIIRAAATQATQDVINAEQVNATNAPSNPPPEPKVQTPQQPSAQGSTSPAPANPPTPSESLQEAADAGQGNRPPEPPTVATGPPLPDDEGQPKESPYKKRRRLIDELNEAVEATETARRLRAIPHEEYGPQEWADWFDIDQQIERRRYEIDVETGGADYAQRQAEKRLGPEPDIEGAAEEERRARPIPRRDQPEPQPRSFWTRAKRMAEAYGIKKPAQLDESLQTDEWKAEHAPLTAEESLATAAEAAIKFTGATYLGHMALQTVKAGVRTGDKGVDAVTGGVVDTIGDIGQSVGGGAMAGFSVGGPVGAAIGAGLGMALEVAKLPMRIMDWTEALIDSKRELVKWNGFVREAAMMAERRGYLRDIQSGRQTGATVSALSGSYQDLLDEIRPIKDTLYNEVAVLMMVSLKQLTGILHVLNEINKYVPLVTGPLGSIVNLINKYAKAPKTSVEAWADTMRNLQIGPKQRAPKRP